ncbi:alpha/beta fold hydrolase [Fodinicola acaciae]|uniref:alpha/beta fold hydrolase n=1 Tax=Fodinicola acaciae TaxID=2681555 RepID=UPI0013D11314|nr:alpha/beta hydrolase [Fodinicola acaciae]
MERRKMLAATSALALAATGAPTVPADVSLPGFRSAMAEVNGTRLHYVAGGRGAPLILLPGWPQTWWQFHRIMPLLAKHYRVIAVDLRGMNRSAKPATGYDKKTMARDIRDLVRALGYQRAAVAGHDIGAMVAQSLAANFPESVTKIALLDVMHPDQSWYGMTLVPRPGESFYLWWFAFNQVHGLPERLLTGRFRLMADAVFGMMLVNPTAIDERDRAIYAHAYSTPEAIRAGNGWYQTFSQDIEDQRAYPRLRTPVLGLVSGPSYGFMAAGLPKKAVDPTIRRVENSGHFIVDEQPDVVASELLAFFR